VNGSLRVAVGQISCESNTFARFRCDLETVRTTGYLLEGERLFELRGTDNEVSGACTVLEGEAGATVVPLMASRWNSSSVLQAEAHAVLRETLLGRLREAGPVNGVLLSCHGSMVATDSDDPEADLAEAVRGIVGPEVPVAMTLDLHANVTDRMVRSIDLIVGYEHYPHDDAHTTGQRAARLLLDAIRGRISPTMARVRLPMIQTAFHASTSGDGPFARLERSARAREREAGVLSVSNFHVGSYIDVPEMGCSTLVITDADSGLARRHAIELAEAYWRDRHEYLVDRVSVAEAVRRGRELDAGPVLLLNTADTTGGGAAGDSISVAAGLLEAGIHEPALAMVVDPPAAAAWHPAGPGARLRLEVGHRVDPRWGRPVLLEGRVAALVDGRFRYTGGIFGGTDASMGPSAVFEVGPLRLLIMTASTYDWADEQYRSAGLDPTTARWVEAKNMMNFRRTYGHVMRAAYVLDAPGPTPADMRDLPFERARRPWFPMDDIQEPTFDRAEHAMASDHLA
jgi:microcystin degradation protein MlrC